MELNHIERRHFFCLVDDLAEEQGLEEVGTSDYYALLQEVFVDLEITEEEIDELTAALADTYEEYVDFFDE